LGILTVHIFHNNEERVDLKTRVTFAAIAGAYLLVSAIRADAQSGSIAGRVLDDSGTPISGATVLYRNQLSYIRNSQGGLVSIVAPVRSGTTTASDGSFAVGGLPAGTYHICAVGVTARHLSSCEWELASLVQLAAGQTLSGISVTVSIGSLLTILVSDPNGRIQDAASGPIVNGLIPLSGGNFKIGVMTGIHYVAANFVSQTGIVRSYSVAVPKTGSFKLLVSTSLKVLSPVGQAVAIGSPDIPILPSGQAQVFVNLAIQ
jgi:hypothetical protein